MHEVETNTRLEVFQICFFIKGGLTFLNDDLKKVLKNIDIDNISFSDLFIDQQIPTIVKKRKSNFLPCISQISPSGFVEILKTVEIGDNEWQMIFVQSSYLDVKKSENISAEALLVLLDAIPHPVFIKDNLRRYLYVNKSFSVLYGISKKKIVGQKDEDFLDNQKEINLLSNADYLVINEGEDVEISEYTHSMKSDDKLSLFTLKLAYGNQASTRKILGISIDTTSRKKYKHELEKTSFELENFVYRTSHDLIGPIKTLKGLIYVGRLDPDNFLKSISLDRFEEVLNSLDLYIRELIDFAYNKSALVSLEKVNLKNMLFNAYTSANKWVKHTETLVRLNVDADISIYSDADRLQSVLHIVFSNALQFSKPGKQYIDVTAVEERKTLRIEIQDYGIGIKEQIIPKVFDMYFRGTQGATGSGLGLYNAKETLKKLKGSIVIESEVGVGTKVIINLPTKIAD